MKDYYDLDELNLPDKMTYRQCAMVLNIAMTTMNRLVESGAIKETKDNHILCSTLTKYLIKREAANLPVEDEEMFDDKSKRVGRVENEDKDEIEIQVDELYQDDDLFSWTERLDE